MRPVLLNNCLAKSKTLEKVKNFFEDICNLKLQLLDSEGRLIVCGEQHIQVSTDRFHSSLILDDMLQAKVAKDVFVPANIVAESAATKMPIQFLCSKGYRNFLVPLINREKVVGFLTTGEKEGVALGERQVKSIIVFLQDILKKSLEEDLVVYKDFAGQPFSAQQRILNKVLKYITENYATASLTLKEVAVENGVSYFHLSHLFKKELKTTFSDYLNNLRISVAMRLLKDKSLTVNQISSMCGYEDPSYFGKVFKKTQGVSPLVFRSQDVVDVSVIPDFVPEFLLQN